tara:strand:- start:1161 stop:1556 length:396 start_codon:yes stop_codon:yes gene_type:complete
MAKNYTFNASMSCTATSGTGYSQSQSGAFTLDLTGIDAVQTGRIDVATTNTTICAAPAGTGIGKVVYVRNLDDTNWLSVYSNASAGDDVIGILEPGEWLFTILRDTQVVSGDADTATVTVEYFAVEIDSNA